MEKEHFALMDEGIRRKGSKVLHETTPEELSASGDYLGSHDAGNFENTTSWPRETPNGQGRPSPVPSSDARVRWAMMASLAGVRKSSTPGGSPKPDVGLSHEGEQTCPGIQENRNRLSNSHESKRLKTGSVGPHIPIRSQSGSIHERKSSDGRANANISQEKPDTLISNPTSIEQYLKTIRNDPNIDDRGLRDGLQSLMLGSGDSNQGKSISQDSKTPKESKMIAHAPDAKTWPESIANSALTSNVTQGHDKPDSRAKASKTPDVQVLSGNSYFPSPVHQQSSTPSQLANDWGKPASSYGSARPKTSGSEKDARQSKPSAHLQDHHDNANQHHRIPNEVHHNASARPQPNQNPGPATRLAQGPANTQHESRPTPSNTAIRHEMKTASPQSKAGNHSQGLEPSQKSVPSFPPNFVRPQSATSQSFLTSLPAKAQHYNHNDSAAKTPATSNYAPFQPLPTPPQTPGLGGGPSLNKTASTQEIPHVSQLLDERSPTNPTPQINTRSIGSAADSNTSRVQNKETDLPHLQLNESIKNPQPSLPKSCEPSKILHSPISLRDSETNRQSPAAVLRAQVAREREEKRQSQQQQLSSEPRAPASSAKILSDIPRRDLSRSSNVQKQEHIPKPSNASRSPHQSSRIPQTANNNVKAEHSPSPAAAIRAQVAQERAARMQAQEETQQSQKEHSSPSTDPPISAPQAMLNLVKDKAKASVDAAAGNPGFIDRESSFIHFPSHCSPSNICRVL